MRSAPNSQAAATPQRARRSVDEALTLIEEQGQEWTPPASGEGVRLVAHLRPGGSSNHSFLVGNGDDRLVLRLDGIDPTRNGIHREAEFRIQAAAATAGLAPRPRFCDAGKGILLVDYMAPDIEAGTTSAADIADMLRAIHRLAIAAPRLYFAARAAHYHDLLWPVCDADSRHLLARLAGPLQRACRALDNDQHAAVVCHNDLTSANRLYHRGALYALDWEYAARGSRWFDLAVAAETAPAVDKVLTAYLQREPTAQERALMANAGDVAAYLDLLWRACNTGFAGRELQDALHALNSRVSNRSMAERAS